MQKDLTYGEDIRGDEALFINRKHFTDKGWGLDKEVKDFLSDKSQATFFRVIDDNGREESGHGWIEDGEIFQWG